MDLYTLSLVDLYTLICGLPPHFVLFLGIIILTFPHGRMFSWLSLLPPAISILQIIMFDPQPLNFQMTGIDLAMSQVNQYSKIFALGFSVALFVSIIYSFFSQNKLERIFAYIHASSAIGIAYSGNLMSMFIYWEMMSVAGIMLIWCARNQNSFRAGFIYSIMHFLSGVLLLSGIMLLKKYGVDSIDDASLCCLSGDAYFSGATLGVYTLLSGILINAGIPPLSLWLYYGYSNASFKGSVFLSSFTTKSAILCLIWFFSGLHALVYIGAFTAIYGGVYAFMSRNTRLTLSYSIICQVGLMISLIGIGTNGAITAAVTIAIAHILYMLVLFMISGLEELHKTSNDMISGDHVIFRAVYFISLSCLISLPLTNSFIGKTMVSSIADINFPWFKYFALLLLVLKIGIACRLYLVWSNKVSKFHISLPQMIAMMLVAILVMMPYGIWGSLLDPVGNYSEFFEYDIYNMLYYMAVYAFLCAICLRWIRLIKCMEIHDIDYYVSYIFEYISNIYSTQMSRVTRFLDNQYNKIAMSIPYLKDKVSAMPVVVGLSINLTVVAMMVMVIALVFFM